MMPNFDLQWEIPAFKTRSPSLHTGHVQNNPRSSGVLYSSPTSSDGLVMTSVNQEAEPGPLDFSTANIAPQPRYNNVDNELQSNPGFTTNTVSVAITAPEPVYTTNTIASAISAGIPLNNASSLCSPVILSTRMPVLT